MFCIRLKPVSYLMCFTYIFEFQGDICKWNEYCNAHECSDYDEMSKSETSGKENMVKFCLTTRPSFIGRKRNMVFKKLLPYLCSLVTSLENYLALSRRGL